jgi:hypothetical protein
MATIFRNITSVSEIKASSNAARGSVFMNFEVLEFVAVESSSLRRKKNDERSKQSIENLSETSSQKFEKSCSG